MTSTVVDVRESQPDRAAEAIAWARGRVQVDAVTLMRQSPWGITLRLDGPAGACFLKVLPPSQIGSAASVVAISTALAGAVPATIAGEVSRGWLISADHGGQPLGDGLDEAHALLRAYVDIQARSVRVLDRLADVPRLSLSALWSRTRDFLGGPVGMMATARHARLADFIGVERAALMADACDAVSAALLRRFAQCETVSWVLEHGDLNLGNVARTARGGLVLHDWDTACIGPPGLSLSSIVGGTARLCAGLGTHEAADDDVSAALVRHYARSLADAGIGSLDELHAILPSAVLVGLFMRLAAYADYPPGDESERALCEPDLAQISHEILAWCCQLAIRESAGDVLPRLADRLHAQRFYGGLLALAREAGADAIVSATPTPPAEVLAIADLVQAQHEARHDARVPSLIAGSALPCDPGLMEPAAEVAADMFSEHGCLAIEAAFAPTLLARCLAHHQAGLACERGVWPEVGEGRTMLPLRVGGPFNTPDLYAHPLLMRLLERLLGPDFLIGSMTMVVARAGAAAQHLHTDHPPLFGGSSLAACLPPHAVTLLIPLVDIDDVVGGTELRKGSHQRDDGEDMPGVSRALPLGGCLLFDYRLLHRGLANRSDRERPVLSIVYQRDWFRDAVNFRDVPALRMSVEELMRVPASLSGLFRHAELVR
jgi:hypothetical protein